MTRQDPKEALISELSGSTMKSGVCFYLIFVLKILRFFFSFRDEVQEKSLLLLEDKLLPLLMNRFLVVQGPTSARVTPRFDVRLEFLIKFRFDFSFRFD